MYVNEGRSLSSSNIFCLFKDILYRENNVAFHMNVNCFLNLYIKKTFWVESNTNQHAKYETEIIVYQLIEGAFRKRLNVTINFLLRKKGVASLYFIYKQTIIVVFFSSNLPLYYKILQIFISSICNRQRFLCDRVQRFSLEFVEIVIELSVCLSL